MVPWTLSLARRDEGRPSGAGTVEGREIGIGELIFGIAEHFILNGDLINYFLLHIFGKKILIIMF